MFANTLFLFRTPQGSILQRIASFLRDTPAGTPTEVCGIGSTFQPVWGKLESITPSEEETLTLYSISGLKLTCATKHSIPIFDPATGGLIKVPASNVRRGDFVAHTLSLPSSSSSMSSSLFEEGYRVAQEQQALDATTLGLFDRPEAFRRGLARGLLTHLNQKRYSGLGAYHFDPEYLHLTRLVLASLGVEARVSRSFYNKELHWSIRLDRVTYNALPGCNEQREADLSLFMADALDPDHASIDPVPVPSGVYYPRGCKTTSRVAALAWLNNQHITHGTLLANWSWLVRTPALRWGRVTEVEDGEKETCYSLVTDISYIGYNGNYLQSPCDSTTQSTTLTPATV